ncbi:MAG: NAD-dependent epimerase/dehydratase family protein [Anaerolineales bacterium]|nr:NAD-dependent epimerase/dehydratase family protein [Anaerolineales bacterium]
MLRYFNVYGPRQRPDSMYAAAVPIFIRRMLDNKPITVYGDGGQSRDLVNVRDVVQANLLASTHPAAPGQIFNVCTGVETRLLDLLDILYEVFPNAPKHVHAEPRQVTSTVPSARPKKSHGYSRLPTAGHIGRWGKRSR